MVTTILSGAVAAKDEVIVYDGTGRHQAVRLPCLEDGVPQLRALLDRDVQLPAELADVGDARGQHGHPRDLDLLAGPERESRIRDVVRGDRSVHHLAEIAQLSRYHFGRAFKRSFGLPPHRYHMNRRIERAKSLLRERARSVTEVGLMLGFCDTSAFTTSFRRAMGMTPSDYRRTLHAWVTGL